MMDGKSSPSNDPILEFMETVEDRCDRCMLAQSLRCGIRMSECLRHDKKMDYCTACKAGKVQPCVIDTDFCPMDEVIERMEQESREIAFPPIVRVYLAGPVDLVSRETATSWRKEVGDILARHGVICYLPNMPWMMFSKYGEKDLFNLHAEWIDGVNRAAIAECDLLFANLHRMTLGTIREIEFARGLGKPVVAIIKEEKNIVCAHDLQVYKSIPAALQDILKYTPKGMMCNG